MKLYIIFLMCLIMSVAHADPLWDADGITDSGKLEVAYQAVALMDWSQTRYIAKNPDQYRELNPLIGEHPTINRVDAWFISTGIAHAAVSHVLSQEHTRIWQISTILLETAVVVHNRSIGIKFDW